MTDLSNREIKGYFFAEIIGQGGFATVYKARQTSLDREVAVKAILPTHLNDPNVILEFQVEARLVANLQHDAIVEVYDFWTDEHGAFIAMRLLTGGTLRDEIDRGPIDPTRCAELFERIALALNFAHRRKIVHRDIKPENVMFDNEGIAYVSDFGLAKAIGAKLEDDQISGTLWYMSPEQISGFPPEPKSDIYSLGIMLYEMLTGSHPFPGVSPSEVIMKHLNEELPLIYEIQPDISVDVDQVIRKLTHKDETQRYQNLSDAVNELNQALGRKSEFKAESEFVFSDKDVIIQQIISDNISVLENRLYEIYEKLSTEKNVDLEDEVRKLRDERVYRESQFASVSQLVPIEIPLVLQLPALPDHNLLYIQAQFDKTKGAILAGKSIALIGPAGVGKSVLALSLAHNDEIKAVFGNQIIHLPIGSNPNLFDLFGDMLKFLGFDQDLSRYTSIEDRYDILIDMIASRTMLIVADDVRNADDIELLWTLPETTTLLITSRHMDVALDLDLEIVDVMDLNLEQRFDFLSSLIPDVDLDLVSEEARNFLKKVGGLPRDIVLIGKKLKRSRGNINRLKREIQRLDDQLEDVLETSFELFKESLESLDDEVRVALANLSILPAEPNSFNEDVGELLAKSADYLYDLTDASMLKALSSLPETHSDETRYAIYPSFAEFTRRLLKPEDSIYQQVIDYFVDFIEQYKGKYAQLDLERDNIEQILDIALKNKVANSFINSVLSLHPYWLAKGNLSRAEFYTNEALLLVDNPAVSRSQHIQLLSLASHNAMTGGNLDDAMAYIDKALTLVDGAENTAGLPENVRADLLIQKGRLSVYLEDYEEGLRTLDKGSALLDETTSAYQLSEVYNIKGGIDMFAFQDAERALEDFAKSLKYARADNNKLRMSTALRNLGQLHTMIFHDHQKARTYLNEAIGYARELNHAELLAEVLVARAELEMQESNSDAAISFMEEAVRNAKRSHSVHWTVGTHSNLGRMFIETKAFEKAEKELSAAFENIQKYKHSRFTLDLVDYLFKCGANRIIEQDYNFDSDLWKNVKQLAATSGLPPESVDRLNKVYDLLIDRVHSSNSSEAIWWSHYELGLLERDEFNDPPLALHHFSEATPHALALKQADKVTDTLCNLAKTNAILGHFDTAESNLHQLLALDYIVDESHVKQAAETLSFIVDERKESDQTTIDAQIWRDLLDKLGVHNLAEELEQVFAEWSI